jgi:hypothetical protein
VFCKDCRDHLLSDVAASRGFPGIEATVVMLKVCVSVLCVCVCSCGACEASEGAYGCDRRGEQDFEIHNGGWRSAL